MVATPELRAAPISLEVYAAGLVAVVLTGPAAHAAVRARNQLHTALARTVVGLVAPPEPGRIEVNGQDVTDLPPGRRGIGYVPAGGALLPHLTVRENVSYGLRRAHPAAGKVRFLEQDRVDTLVRELELAHTLDLRPHQLSEGQRLRAALARAAAGNPAVLVLDLPVPEPASGPAKPVEADDLSKLIKKATPKNSAGAAVLACTCDPAWLRGITDQVTVPVEAVAP